MIALMVSLLRPLIVVTVVSVAALLVGCADTPRKLPAPVSNSDQQNNSNVVVRPLPDVADPLPSTSAIKGQAIARESQTQNKRSTGRSAKAPRQRSSKLGLDKQGRAVYLSDFFGKVVVVAYWASWCPPCWSELAQLQVLYSEYKNKGVEIVAVNLGETQYSVDRFLYRQSKKLTYNLVLDQGSRLSRQKGVGFPPVTDLFDRRGQRVKRYTGFTGFSADDLRRRFKQLL